MRLDGLLGKLNIASRSDAKKLIRSGKIMINREKVTDPGMQVSENDIVTFEGKEYTYQKYVYYMLNKPAGCVSATEDEGTTVIDIFKTACVKKYGELPNVRIDELFPVGRLDKDTTGLLIITNDGDMAHRVLSYKYHVEKTYFVRLNKPLDKKMIDNIEGGVEIEEGVITKPAQISLTDEPECWFITICEGKFHQVKRMFKCVGCEVLLLKRVSFGEISLDEDLPEGDLRLLTQEEIDSLHV